MAALSSSSPRRSNSKSRNTALHRRTHECGRRHLIFSVACRPLVLAEKSPPTVGGDGTTSIRTAFYEAVDSADRALPLISRSLIAITVDCTHRSDGPSVTMKVPSNPSEDWPSPAALGRERLSLLPKWRHQRPLRGHQQQNQGPEARSYGFHDDEYLFLKTLNATHAFPSMHAFIHKL
jgi:hypothetical protein